MPVSMFGRASAASAYALIKVLYNLEFTGLPEPRAPVGALLKRVAVVVDRCMTPAQYDARASARLPGVPLDVMHLPPVCGGVGLLPLVHHVAARHVGLAVRCVLVGSVWVAVVCAAVGGRGGGLAAPPVPRCHRVVCFMWCL